MNGNIITFQKYCNGVSTIKKLYFARNTCYLGAFNKTLTLI